MKNIIIAASLLMVNSTVYAGPGVSRVGLGLFEMIGNSITRKLPSIPRSDFTVRRFSTQGYRPTEPIKLDFQYDAASNQKIRFLDKSHERYMRLNQSSKAPKEKGVGSTEQKDDHTLVVDLKKK